MRVILYTGKGGVGKTSVAAATALRSAELGHRTMVLSTDSAHSLADSFDTTLSGKAEAIAPNLWAQETDLYQTLETHWGTIKDWMAALMAWRGMEEIVAEEMAVLPGMEELASLLYIIGYHDSGHYDVVIVDCAPTGETLRLLSFPDILDWWMQRLFPIGRTAAAVTRPLMKHLLGMPMPDDAVFASAEDLFTQLERMRVLLTDPDTASVRLVLNPEKMVIKETQRTFTYLNLYGYATDLIVCNRLIPDEVKDRHFDSWKESQERYYQMVEERFAPLPILTIPLFSQEVVGIPMLRLMAQALFGDEDPTKVFYHGQTHDIRKEDGNYVLTLPLPFVQKEEINLMRNGDELTIQAGRHKRNISLPRILAGLPVKEARFEGERLRIDFEERKE
ncbi:MAG: arsenic-transporting ATPase [Chloroflexi bacterium RBG_13_54_9]|nr:MAG: arsenic-transporting ATPase [Chloroflexi bacterium RBG_13_54_9]